MNSFEVSEEQLKNLDVIASAMLYDKEDPRSNAYQRRLVRPRINWLRILVICMFVLAGAIGIYRLLIYAQIRPIISLTVCLMYLLLIILIRLKSILISLIQIYQRYAPASIRNKCRFVPSCSEYMILCLQKHGLVKGLAKGINRLSRCNIYDGGFDYP